VQKLILATRNPGKSKEIRAILHSLPIEIISLLDTVDLPEVVEDGTTLELNALKKAREIFRAAGIPSLADDSGLEVYALGMRPGVLSARFAGERVSYEANNQKLLHEMRDLPQGQRGARFRCVTAFVARDLEKISEGICTGKIIAKTRGRGGFGYDPLFVPDGYDKTFAELSLEVKNRISHRAQALQMMKLVLEDYFLKT
jgi:XTP/dITP diphosphohydrolase